MGLVVAMPRRRAVAFVERHEQLATFDVLVRFADDRVARITGNFRDEMEALAIGESLALSNGWAFERQRTTKN